MLVLNALLSLLLAYVLWSLARFTKNYVEARKIGLPIVFCPVDPVGPAWLLTKDFLIPIISSLPWGWGEWTQRAEVGWTYYRRYSVHAKFGDAFIIVSPGENDIILADPAATDDILKRRNDFVKNEAVYGMLNIYGSNLDTVNGKQWDRHRKITIPPFNEQNSALVWRETAEQADQMLNDWLGKDQVATTQPDAYAAALNVLCGAGFGLHSSFVDTKLPAGNESSWMQLGYRESLRVLLANVVQLVLLTLLKKAGCPDWLFFGNMFKLSVAYKEFKRYMAEMLDHEKTAFEQGNLNRHNLMSALVRASEQSKEAARLTNETAASAMAGLSDDEVFGNIFIYNLAGHDTTAGTLHFALSLLAAYPEWQAWIAEEIDQVRSADPTGTWYYEETFPKLERCLALMYETLRLYGPVVMMPRYTADAAQRLRIHDREYRIPPKTTVTVNFAALHSHPDYWGQDALAFRPDRWLPPPEQQPKTDSGLFQPAPGAFVAWNAGPRVCPGKKFSQVEFTRIIFGLFAGGSRVGLVPEKGETETEAQARCLRAVHEAKVEVTLKMVGAERIKFRWTKPDM